MFYKVAINPVSPLVINFMGVGAMTTLLTRHPAAGRRRLSITSPPCRGAAALNYFGLISFTTTAGGSHQHYRRAELARRIYGQLAPAEAARNPCAAAYSRLVPLIRPPIMRA
ncbi:hypothetical protein KCP71_23550 [Salmonella enterica subsp. enterica]|nr:hypothetical protein KCP71_23550 [Salmonella enterica subsp. enterica]